MGWTPLRFSAAGVMALGLAACGETGLDPDFRNSYDTSEAAARAGSAGARPEADARGVLSYPTYQVAQARRGDTVASVAGRVGIPVEELARYNALPADVRLREGEILALPRRVPAAGPTTGPAGTAIATGTIIPAASGVDVTAIAGGAIERADAGGPVRHRVAPGETAFSIARNYGVPVTTLADWNGLGSDLAVRDGQYLLIPVQVRTAAAQPIEVATPGSGSAAPMPPSSSRPLPRTADAEPEPAPSPAPAAERPRETRTAAAPVPTPVPAPAPAPRATPERAPAAAAPASSSAPLDAPSEAVSDTARLRMPVSGRIVRSFEKGRSDGIGIAATAGAPVAAAADGTVAAITRDTDQVPILVLRHEGNLLTVYAGVEAISVEKGDRVRRGQRIAAVRNAGTPALHFEVREGFESVDPVPYLE